jgi:dTDP-glucose pyrophosphorylase/CBS domain-containing protein
MGEPKKGAGSGSADKQAPQSTDIPTAFYNSNELAPFIVNPDTTLRDTIQLIDGNGAGIAVVVGPDLEFLNVVTDGDIRRAILKGIDLAEPIEKVLAEKAAINTRRPVVANVDDPPEFVLLLMERLVIHQIPLLDSDGKLRRVVHRDALSNRPRVASGHAAVVMAGGFGTRLRPLTATTPKPMLKVDGRPILEHIVTRIAQAGIERIFITVHYKPEVIIAHFGDGSRFGVQISYIHETEPLGTAGSVLRADHGGQPLLVMNGDVMTDLNFASLFDFHKRTGAVISMAASLYEVGVPYGVISVDGVNVTGLEEKPIKRFFINTGIYVLSPDACSRIVPDTIYNMTDLIDGVVAAGDPVKVYAMHEYWRDIGRVEDLERVNKEMRQRRLAL